MLILLLWLDVRIFLRVFLLVCSVLRLRIFLCYFVSVLWLLCLSCNRGFGFSTLLSRFPAAVGQFTVPIDGSGILSVIHIALIGSDAEVDPFFFSF